DNAFYVLNEDVVADGTAVVIEGSGITLDLNGKSVVFGNNTPEMAFGIQLKQGDHCKIVNGEIIQGAKSSDYSNAIRSFNSAVKDLEVCGISTNVHLKNAQPMVFRHAHINIHHNHLYSSVTELDSRHYPGNSLLRIDASGDS